MVDVRMVDVTQEHIDSLAPRLRNIDKLECYHMSGLDARSALQVSVKYSDMSFVVTVDGIPHAIWGVTPMSHWYGAYRPWMLMSDWSLKNKRLFWRLSKKYVDGLTKMVHYLENYILAINEWSIRWLQHLGFTIHKEIEILNGQQWRKFSMEIK